MTAQVSKRTEMDNATEVMINTLRVRFYVASMSLNGPEWLAAQIREKPNVALAFSVGN